MGKKQTKVISNLSHKNQTMRAGNLDLCSVCGYIWPFVQHPDGSKTEILGSYPFCRGNWRDHMTRKVEFLIRRKTYLYSPNAIKVKTTVWMGPNGEISIPGHSDEKVPKGYEKRELLSLAEVDSFTREMQISEKRKYDLYHEYESKAFSEYYAQQGRELRAGGVVEGEDSHGNIVRTVIPSWDQMSEMGKELAREAERQYSQYRGHDPNYIPPVFFQAAHYDERTLRQMESLESNRRFDKERD